MPPRKRVNTATGEPAETSSVADPSASAPAPATASNESATETQTTELKKPKKHHLGVDPSLIISEGRSKRRRSPSPHSAPPQHEDPDPKDPARAKELGMVIYDKIMAQQNKEGEVLSQPFIKLPSKKLFPDYYETIKHPMSLEMVKQKLDEQEYQTLKDVCADFGQIFNNAKRYNVRESVLFQWAKKLHKITRVYYSQKTNPKHKDESDSEAESNHETGSRAGTMQPETVETGGGAPGASSSVGGDEPQTKKKKGPYTLNNGPTVYKLVKPVLKAIKEAKSYDGSAREIAEIFMHLPDRKELPDYYKTISNPISLEEIEIKHSGRRYDTWEEFFSDMELMCDNAMTYNADESEVYQDAKQIKDILTQHRGDVQLRSTLPPGTKLKTKPTGITPIRSGGMQHSYASSPSLTVSPAAGSTLLPPTLNSAHYAQHVGQSTMPSHVAQQSSWSPSSPQIQQQYQYQQQHQKQQQRQHAQGYNTALPPGVVTEDVVASLGRYPAYEQQSWLATLSPQMLALYRQMAAAMEHRKRTIPATTSSTPSYSPYSASLTLTEPPRTAAPIQQPQAETPVQKRPAPSFPSIKFIDFNFTPSNKPEEAQTIRLRNLKGIFSHVVLLDSRTSDLRITAYPDPSILPAGSDLPEMNLKLDGSGTGVTLVKPVLSPDGLLKGTEWALSVPLQELACRVEIVGSLAGGGTDSSVIFLNRQY